MARVELRSVAKSYGGKPIVRDVSLDVADGEFLVLVGPSGCGKSTILRMVAGLEEITAGELLIDGRRANDLTPRERDVAMVFQSYALYPHMTVAQNMGFALKVRGTPRADIERRVAETARMLEIEPLLDRFPRQLSGGQRQRVAMGRAVVRHPKVFLFDEPLSNLDAALRGQMRVELKRLHRALAATVVYVTHDHVEAMTLADRIAVVHEGLVQQTGTPAEVFGRPVNRFVAGFIGAPRMNFLDGTLREGGTYHVEGDGFSVPLGEPFARLLRGRAGSRLTVGVRPPHLALRPAGAAPAAGEARFEGTLDVTEPMGWETYLHVRLVGGLVTAQVESRDAQGLAPGGRLLLAARPELVHLFDADGRALLPGAGAERDAP